ncbi:type I polyketide synthase, partial [Hamadaea sp. NPDC051192]|uniref:type I polyketide synthase n=1 Tax=Hamadaea sp. NPDC051192 TaxID=3154940 RepID=UPI00342FA2B0
MPAEYDEADGAYDGVEPIAVIGLAARVPGASDVEEFWRNLLDGVESVSRFDRDEQLARGVSAADLDDPSWVSAAPVLEKFDHFDAELFGMTEQEARLADPQHRLLLETVHAALENAGYDPARYAGDIGLFCGAGGNQYHWEYLAEDAPLWAAHRGSLAVAIGNSPSYLATMASYKLNLRGPSLAVHTACSTSLVAIHLACESLRNGECDAALAGGVSVELPHAVGYRGSDGFLSDDGHCRPFDAEAGGTLWGSGVGVVMLKRLADAIADGDTIRAVVRGSAVNNDGAAKVGFSAPSVSGQQQVVEHALDAAGVDPRTIGYVEAHGTGTALGDPIEVRALTRAYGRDTADVGWCGLGTAKANIGHLSQAAGVVGFIKAALTVERGLVPPTINIEQPTPAIDFGKTPFRLVTSVAGWPAEEWPRRAAVSSFGIGGTNAHAILEQPPAHVPATRSAQPRLLRLSAMSPEALRESAQRLSANLADQNTDHNLDDVAYTLGMGRAEHPHRAVVVAEDVGAAAAALADRKRLKPSVASGHRTVAFLLSGQGAQYAGMAAELYEHEPVFREAIQSLGAAELLRLDEEKLRQTQYAQPALFAVEYALARTWESWGVTPSALLGHSIGEYVAATLAGVFAPADAMRLVTERGRLMQQLPPGAMLAVQLDEADVVGQLPEPLSVAAINGPGTCVVAGPVDAVATFAEKLKADGIGSRALRTSHAFHSAMTEPILDEFARVVAAVPRRTPTIPFVSNVTGEWITAEDAVDPMYWARHIRRPVRFGDGLRTLLAGDPVLLECGPGRQLAGLARLQSGRDAVPPVHSLPGVGEKAGELATLAQAAGALWAAGVPVAGDAFTGNGHRVPLPGYAYQRKRYWVTPSAAPKVAAKPASGGRLPLERWFAEPVWRQHTTSPSALTGDAYVLSGGPRGDALAETLGATVLRAAAVPTGQCTVVHGLALDADDDCYLSALALVQAIAAEDASDRVRVVLVSRSAEDVLGGDLTMPQHATLAGISRVVPLELPALAVRRIDVDDSVTPGSLAAEVGRDDLPEVALRGTRRWSLAYEQVTLPEGDGPLRDGGRYLITGGLGGIGLTLAEDLAARFRARLVLIGRSAATPAAASAIARMEATGGHVVTVAADVTDPQALHLVRQAAQAAFGGLDGIVHAAGVAGGAMVEVADPAGSRAVLGPKVDGTRALHEVFGDLELDFVALCSSVTAVAGALGQADYCAANAFLDAYARSTHGWRTRVVSLNWGGWSEVGMAAQTPAPAALSALREAGKPMAHPMLTTLGEGECSGVLSPQSHWLLDEHRIGGVPVVPGTAHL